MPDTRSVNKVARSAEKRRLRNRSARSSLKTNIGKAEKIIGSGETDTAQQVALTAISSIDKAVGKGLIHKNKAARLKSRLVKKTRQPMVEKDGG